MKEVIAVRETEREEERSNQSGTEQNINSKKKTEGTNEDRWREQEKRPPLGFE